jgi:Lrp/AsnC family transcriptional regulator, leucine-responsive regulatory protein
MSAKKIVLDALDRKLIAAVQVDNQRSAEDIGAEIGLSPSACLRRLKKLKSAGVIKANISVIDPVALGRQLMMIVHVSLERERFDLIDKFKKEARRAPEVMQCYYVTGQSDFLLIVSAKDMADYEEFTKRFFFDNVNVRRFETQVVMDRVKIGLSLPVDD